MYRVPITIDHTKVGSTTAVTNIPLLFNTGTSSIPASFKYTGFGGKVGKTDGTDILFTKSDGTTKLNHEIEKYASTTGEIVAWVNFAGTLSTTTDDVIYMYYGNSGASDQQNITGVWDVNYQEVYHFATSSANTLKNTDSTANARDITLFNSPLRS